MPIFHSLKRSVVGIMAGVLVLSELALPLSLFVEDTYAAPTILSTLTVTADGIAPFDTTTYDPLAGTNTGTDASASNGIVKAGSIIDYDLQVTINNEGSTNVYFTSTLPAGFTWESLPLGCLTSGVSPISAITSGSGDLVCNLGDSPNGGADPGTLAVTLRVRVGAGVSNDTSIVLTGGVQSDQVGAVVPSTPSSSTRVTLYVAPTQSEPQFEIGKESWLHGSDISLSTLQHKVFPGSDGVTPGRIIPYIIYVRAPKNTAGFSASENLVLEDTFTLLDENNTPVTHSAQLWTWGVAAPCSVNYATFWMNYTGMYPYAKVGQYPQASSTNSVPDSGTIGCVQSVPGGPVTLYISGIDMRNTSGPTSAAQAAFPQGATYNYQGVYILWYWVPLTDIDNASLSLSGSYYKNTISGTGGLIWDPTSTGGISNYGTGYEPQADNVAYHYSQFGTGNTMLWGTNEANTHYGVTDLLGGRIHSLAFNGNQYAFATTKYGSKTDAKNGNRVVTPNTEIGQSIVNDFYHYGSGFTASVCEKLDPTKMELTGTYPDDSEVPMTQGYPLGYPGEPTRKEYSEMFQMQAYSNFVPSYTGAVTIEYATSPNTPNQRDATCTDADGPWFSSMALAGTGNITKMRITYTVPTVYESTLVTYRGFMGVKVKPTYPLGVVPAWISSSYDGKSTWNQFDYQNINGAISSINPNDTYYSYVFPYNEGTPGSWFSSADRLTVSSARATVQKDTVPSSVGSIQMGKEVTYILKPTLSGSTSVSYTGSDYVVRDFMASPLSYIYGSSSIPLDTGYPQVTATGTILQWTLSNVTPSSTLPQITYKAASETTSPTSPAVPNTVVVTYPYDISAESFRSATYNIALVQNSQYGITKVTPTPEVPVDGTLHYQLKYRNFTVLPNIPPESKYIDIFPYNTDGNLGARTKAPSTFTGGYHLTSVSGSNLETFEYTSRSPASIHPDPCHVSNQLLGATGALYCMQGLVGGTLGTATTKWCDPLDFGTPGCPTTLADATAFRMTLPTALNNDTTKVVDIFLDSFNNRPGNIYTNTVGTRRQGFNLYTASNQATIHVYGASVGDRVWFDANSDGIQASGSGEYGIGGIGVTLERIVSGNPVETLTTTTDANGNYLFTDLLAGDYRVTVSNSLGLTETYDLDGTASPNRSSFTLGGIENKRDVDFGYTTTTASVGDRVWFDTNNNGIQDSGEKGIAGITVSITDGASVNRSLVTDSQGYYSFTGLSSGAYTITVTPPLGTTATYDLDGTGSPHTSNFSLGATEIKTDVDFGYTASLGSLGDQAWLENGTNTTYDGGDVLLENIPVTLSGTDYLGNTTSQSTITSSTGWYLFEGLVAGNYTVTIDPVGYFPYSDLDGTSSPNRIDTTLTAGQNRTDVDFSVKDALPVGSLGDQVWQDTNSNGIKDPSENGYSGITLTLSGTDSLGNTVTGTTLTDSSGVYIFPSLASGTYTVTVSPPPASSSPTYDLDGTGSAHVISNISLAPGQNRTDIDFGYRPTPAPLGSIGDVVWYDANNNQIQELTETGIAGVTVVLSGSDSLGNAVNQTVLTSATGYYLFALVPAGTYMVSVVRSGGATLYTPTYDLDGTLSPDRVTGISLLPGATRTDLDFGYYVPQSTGGGGGGGSGGGGGISTPPPSTLAPPLGFLTGSTGSLTPPEPTTKPTVKPTIKKPVKNPIISGEALPRLLFVLPKKLLDTGTSLAKKGVRIARDPRVETEAMFPSKTYGFARIEEAPTDIAFWKERLRLKLGKKYQPALDGAADSYVVIPTLGLVTPITDILTSTSKTRYEDYDALVSGNEIKVNPYLHDGVLHYPRSADVGKPGNMILSGHSSYWVTGLGRYKTIFGNLMELDAGEEVWVYKKQADASYRLYRYRVKASYNTLDTDVDILLPGDNTPKITLFTCTPVGGVATRWVIQGTLIGK